MSEQSAFGNTVTVNLYDLADPKNPVLVGVSTVETHRANLMQKLNLHNTAEIVLYAVRKGLIR